MARIVLVEDTPHAQQLVAYLLTAAGHEVLTADTGRAGLALVRAERPDLSLFDIQLPDLDGYELIGAVRCDPAVSSTTVLAVTANAMLGDRNAALAAGFDGYITKPIDPKTFVGVIDAYLPVALRSAGLPTRAPRPPARRSTDAETAATISVGIVSPFVGRWYFGHVFAGIEEGFRAFDVNLILHSTGADGGPGPHTQRASERLRGRVDGVLMLSLPAVSPVVAGLFGTGTPVVLIGTTSPGRPGVSIDDASGARAAVEHLVTTGRRRIALIGGDPSASPFVPENARTGAYVDVLTAHGHTVDPALQVDGHFTPTGGQAAMDRLLELADPPDAVFCMSDEMAIGALQSLARRGLRPGADVAVVGFDGHELAETMDLTTVEQPVRDLGRLGAKLLMSHILDPTHPHASVLPTRLVVRGSTAG